MSERYAKVDEPRLRRQLQVVREVMLSANECETWLTLKELETLTHYPPASISADLRHLRKAEHGSYLVEKRRRGEPGNGLWEYRVSAKQEAAA